MIADAVYLKAERSNADSLTGLDLVAHVNARRGIIADENDGEAGSDRAACREQANPLSAF